MAFNWQEIKNTYFLTSAVDRNAVIEVCDDTSRGGMSRGGGRLKIWYDIWHDYA